MSQLGSEKTIEEITSKITYSLHSRRLDGNDFDAWYSQRYLPRDGLRFTS